MPIIPLLQVILSNKWYLPLSYMRERESVSFSIANYLNDAFVAAQSAQFPNYLELYTIHGL